MSQVLQGPTPSPTSTQNQTTTGMLITLMTSMIVFFVIQTIFEYNRYYKQIYLKRLQKRFQIVGRVPPEPPRGLLGWLYEIQKYSELDVLRLIGLDAYMFLRYQTICYKLSLFMCFWGLLVLVPVYSTVANDSQWQKFTLSNVGSSNGDSKSRLWFAAIFGYIFSAYFCQLLYAEYNNFSVRRLQYLVQADPDSPFGDPDTPQQKYFTIMVERIPAHLRSKAALEKFFDNLFPGEVYNVEVALDLVELNNLSSHRKRVRDKLEKAVACYEATGERPRAWVQTVKRGGQIMNILDIDDTNSWLAPLETFIDPEGFGYESFDSLNYYTNKLILLNNKMEELQKKMYENAKTSDKVLERKIKKRHDTRAAAILESITSTGVKVIEQVKTETDKTNIDSWFFGPRSVDYQKVVENELLKVEVLNQGGPSTRDGHTGYSLAPLTDDIENRALKPSNLHDDDMDHPPLPYTTNNDRVFLDNTKTAKSDTLLLTGWHHDTSPKFEVAVNDKGLTVFNPLHSEEEEPDFHRVARKTLKRSDDSNVSLESEERKPRSRSDTNMNLLAPLAPALASLPSLPALPALANNESLEVAQAVAAEGISQAKKVTRKGWLQTRLAGMGAFKSFIEVERAFEILTFGAYYKYSSTAFVTFKSRITESICHQMMLSHDAMEINHAPNPSDIIWENVSIPKSQVRMRNFIVNVGLSVGSLFWSSLVNSVNGLGRTCGFSPFVQGYFSVIVMLIFLLILPFIFDAIARYYEGMKLESEIQNSIMTRYFYYQLVNIYVTVGFGVDDIVDQIRNILNNPHILIQILGKSVPSVSLYFTSLVIVKIFVAVPLEMIRPWQLSTILIMSYFLDPRKCTRRELRTGAFYSWPMLYGWVYPQLMMVLMIQVTYACIAPLLMPICSLFFMFTYVMYKYQLLYVYINSNQSGGYMWYAVFRRSLIALFFASFTLLGYLALDLNETFYAGPFYFLTPLPFCIYYFWNYCEAKFEKQSLNLSLAFAKELDYRNKERQTAGKSIPHDTFSEKLYRQPSLTEKPVYPEPYRLDGTLSFESQMSDLGILGPRRTSFGPGGAGRRGSITLDIHETLDEDEMDHDALRTYFQRTVMPLAQRESTSVGGPGGTPRRLRDQKIEHDQEGFHDET